MTVAQDTGSILCSVCIANYQGIALIDDCIDSVYRQAIDFNIEIIVHDDASSDGSAAHIRAKYPFVRVIESHENVGYCIANNRMAAMATGRYLLLLNNDAMLLPGALDVLRSEAGRIAGPAILTLPQYDAISGELLDIGSRLDPFLNAVPNRDCALADVGMVAGACLWIDQATLEGNWRLPRMVRLSCGRSVPLLSGSLGGLPGTRCGALRLPASCWRPVRRRKDAWRQAEHNIPPPCAD